MAVVPGAAPPAWAAQPAGVRLVPSAGAQLPLSAQERPDPAGGPAAEGPGAAPGGDPYVHDGCVTACAVHAAHRLEPLGERTPPPGHPVAVLGREVAPAALTGPPAASRAPQGHPRADRASTDRGRSPPRRLPASPRSALAAGFRKALGAIADSNVTTLIAAGLLFFLASGPVRGFGVTLGIGVLASMISALVVTRVLADHAASRPWVRRRPRVTGLATAGRVRSRLERSRPELMRRPRRWLALSAAVLAVAASGIAVRGLDLGVEFTGGRLIEYTTTRPVDPEHARNALADAGFPHAVVQSSGDSALSVRTGELSDAQAETVTRTVGTLGGDTEKVRDELIGPSLGEELRHNALIALGVALAAQLLYLTARFRWLFGTAAVAALAHDVVILVGVFAWLGKPLDGVFLAALLTVTGYSVNDSVVVFDRVRELWRRDRTTPLPALTDRAIVQTLPRTVNTGMGAALILAALAVLGGDSLTDFALALLIGLVIGTYSSVFTATPLAIELDRYAARSRPHRR